MLYLGTRQLRHGATLEQAKLCKDDILRVRVAGLLGGVSKVNLSESDTDSAHARAVLPGHNRPASAPEQPPGQRVLQRSPPQGAAHGELDLLVHSALDLGQRVTSFVRSNQDCHSQAAQQAPDRTALSGDRERVGDPLEGSKRMRKAPPADLRWSRMAGRRNVGTLLLALVRPFLDVENDRGARLWWAFACSTCEGAAFMAFCERSWQIPRMKP